MKRLLAWFRSWFKAKTTWAYSTHVALGNVDGAYTYLVTYVSSNGDTSVRQYRFHNEYPAAKLVALLHTYAAHI